MKTMKASDFKARCLAVMDEVADYHEPVLITKNGKPVAELRARRPARQIPYRPAPGPGAHQRRHPRASGSEVGSPRLILLDNWRAELIAAGLVEFPIDGEIAVLATEFDALHGDPADSFIAATAIQRGATLLTADTRLLAWKHRVKRQDARK